MQYFTEQGLSHKEVLRKIKEKYGDSAKILSHRTIRLGGIFGLFTKEGVEVSGYISTEEVYKKQRQLMDEKNRIINAAVAHQNGSAANPDADSPSRGTPETKTTVSQGDINVDVLLKELKEIKEQVSRREEESPAEDHANLVKIENMLAENDFSYGLIREILKELRTELSFAVLDDFEELQYQVVSKVCEKIRIYSDINKPGPRRIILIGPTGVGKTTTIAKLAAMSIMRDGAAAEKTIRMITIDNYRIGAKGQLETYGDIMNIPVAAVDTREDMKKKIDLFSDADIIFVDTTGRCHRDYKNIASMREILEPCGSKAEYYLAVSATTKASDVREILKEFDSFGYNALVLTKLDETQRIGNIISVLGELDKPLAYVTFGQGVPADIEEASKLRLIKNLDGFTVNVERLEREGFLD